MTLSNLAKQARRGKTPEDEVSILAAKFCGSGGTVNVGYRSLLQGSLAGAEVPMDGRILVDEWIDVDDGSGERGFLLDLSDANRLILRLARANVTDADRRLAAAWRARVASLSGQRLHHHLQQNLVRLPKPALVADLVGTVDTVLEKAEHQQVWVKWMLDELRVPAYMRSHIESRTLGQPLRDAAPYAHYCMRAELLLQAAERCCIVKSRPSNQVDLQYLFYLPFAQVFVSDDKLHRALAPLLLRADQSFVTKAAFKAGVAEQGEIRSSLEDDKRSRFDRVLGLRPVPLGGNAPHELWEKHMPPWRPGTGNRAIPLSEEERSMGEDEVKALFARARGEDSAARRE